MVLFNAATKELTAKIVYYGPGFGGKTTNLQLLPDRLDSGTVGKLVTLPTQTDRTVSFDMLPVELGEIKGYKVRFQLATVPGLEAFNETRKTVLRGADGIVFVADSGLGMLPGNIESWQNMKDNLRENGASFDTMPIVVQYNKRDLTDILSVEAMQEALGLSSYPFVEAVATAGHGIAETFKLVTKLTFVDLLRRLPGRKADEAAGAPSRRALALVRPQETDARQSEGEAESALWVSAEPAKREDPMGLPTNAAESKERLAAFEERLEAGEKARRAVEKATDTALASLSARSEKLYEEIDEIVRQVAALEGALHEKIAEGMRETGDLRTRIAPLLEGGEQPAADEQGGNAELDRLREFVGQRFSALEAALEEKTAQGLREAGDVRAQIAPLLQMREEGAAAEQRVLAELEHLRESLGRRISALEASVEEKTGQGLRESQEIRAQIAPLLEAREERAASKQKALAEVNRLRESFAQQLSALETAFEEKTAKGLREAEEIRAHIAPLMDARHEHAASEQRTAGELARLRESFADSLAEIADRLRRAVRD